MSTLYSTSINLGSSATFDVGTDANDIVQLDNNARLPAVDGSQLTNLPSSNVIGALVYRGVYDATANNPVLTGAVKGDFYKVSVAGSLAGVVLNINDHIVFNQNASAPITSAMFDVVDNTESTETLDTVTTNGAITTNNITTGQITVDGDVLPVSNLNNSVGSESARFITTFSDLNGAIKFKAKNDQGAQITKGQVIYIKGISGDVPTVGLAQANSALTMPAFGFVAETANDQAECQIITFGNISGLNTSSFSVGDTLYISSTSAGGITNTAPAGEASLIQNIGRVLRSHATEGIIKAGGAGRTNATPNLDQNKIFLGDANNQAVSTALSAVNLSSFNNDLGLATVATTGSYNDLSNTPSLATVATTGSYNDLSNTPTLGTASALDVGINANNVVQLNASSQLPAVDGSNLTNITGTDNTKLAIANNLSDLNNVATARTNLGLATVASTGSYNDLSNTPSLATVATTGSYNDLSNTPTLGTASALDVGINANNVVQLNASAQLPAVDGSLLTNLPSGATVLNDLSDVSTAGSSANQVLVHNGAVFANAQLDYSQVANTPSLATVATTGSYNDLSNTPSIPSALNDLSDVSTAGSSANQVLVHNGAVFANAQLDYSQVANTPSLATVATTGSYNDLSNTPTLGTASALDVGINANNVVQLDGTAKLPAVDGSLLTNLPSSSSPTVTNASPSSAYTISTHAGIEEVYILTPSVDISVNLPSASSCGSGYKYQIKNLSSANTLTIDPNGTETVDGSTTFVLNVQYQSITIVTDGSNWFII